MTEGCGQAGARTAVERAYELAGLGCCADVREIIEALRAEGYATPLTDLRSSLLKRELLDLCRARYRPPERRRA